MMTVLDLELASSLSLNGQLRIRLVDEVMVTMEPGRRDGFKFCLPLKVCTINKIFLLIVPNRLAKMHPAAAPDISHDIPYLGCNKLLSPR